MRRKEDIKPSSSGYEFDRKRGPIANKTEVVSCDASSPTGEAPSEFPERKYFPKHPRGTGTFTRKSRCGVRQ
jgi:hypothetical protein